MRPLRSMGRDRMLLLALIAFFVVGATARVNSFDKCATVRSDPMWTDVRYVPTILEKRLRSKKGARLGPFTCPVCGSAKSFATDWDAQSLRETGRQAERDARCMRWHSQPHVHLALQASLPLRCSLNGRVTGAQALNSRTQMLVLRRR